MPTCTRYVFFWLIFIMHVDLSHVLGQKMGVSFQPIAMVQKAMKSQAFTDAVPDIAANSGGLGSLVKIDYSADPKEVFKNVGDAIVPLLATGLALIPGVGPIIGGILAGVWGIFSSLFGGPPQKSPMQLAIEGMRDEIDKLKETVQKLPEKIIKQTRKEMNEKLKDVFYKLIYGELNRNQYVCNKYALISKDFSDDLRNNRSVNEPRRIELVGSLHNCDNFLKDTATAFVLPEYADVLWIPSVYATLNRVAFLTEVCNYGFSLQLDKSVIIMLWLELKADIERHFEYAAHGIELRVRLAFEMRKKYGGYGDFFKYNNFSNLEMEACRVQSQLLYLDRERYPSGVPEKFVITSNEAELDISDFNVTFSDEPRHIQIFYNEIFVDKTEEAATLLNCIMGPTPLQRTMIKEMAFRVLYIPNKSYQLRVLYFTNEAEYEPVTGYNEWQNLDIATSNRTLVVSQEEANTVRVTISLGKPNENNLQRFLLKSAYNVVQCYRTKSTDGTVTEYCNAAAHAFMGTFVTESVGIFNILTGDELKRKIIVEYKTEEMEYEELTVILGAELIIRPAIV